MSDLARVQAWFDSGALLRPDAGVANTVDLANAIASLACADGVELTSGASAARDAIGETDHIVFVLIDGLGLNLVESLPTTSFLRRHVALQLRAVFPATTAAALTSLATGLWPAQHGVPAWWTYLPEHALTAIVLAFVERFSEQPLGKLGVTPQEVFRAPALAPSFRRDALSFLPRQIAASAYSAYVTGGAPIVAFETLAEAVDGAIDRVRGASMPTYTYLYYPSLDTQEHIYGPHAAQARDELLRVDRELGRLAEGIGGRGRLVASADHGQLAVAQDAKHFVAADDPIMEHLVAPPYGEPRVPFFRLRDGAGASFASQFRERFGEAFALLSIDDVDALRLFGPAPLSATSRGRIGDYIGIGASPEVFVYGSARDRQGPAVMRGFHAGMLPEEMRIPLIVA
jgi:hypothetical protein